MEAIIKTWQASNTGSIYQPTSEEAEEKATLLHMNGIRGFGPLPP